MTPQQRIITLSRYLPYQDGLCMAETTEKPFDLPKYVGNPTNKLVLYSFDYLVKEFHSKLFTETIVHRFTQVLLDEYDMNRCELLLQKYENDCFSVRYKNTATDTFFTILFSSKGISVVGEFTEVFHYQAALEFLYSKHIAYGMEEEEYHDKETFVNGIYQNPILV